MSHPNADACIHTALIGTSCHRRRNQPDPVTAIWFTVIESITTNREPQPGFEAVYLLMPTTENIGRIIRDFEGRQQYAAAHIFFIEGVLLVALIATLTPQHIPRTSGATIREVIRLIRGTLPEGGTGPIPQLLG